MKSLIKENERLRFEYVLPNDPRCMCWFDKVLHQWRAAETFEAVRVKVRRHNCHYKTWAVFMLGNPLLLKRPDGSVTPLVLEERIVSYKDGKHWYKWENEFD
jgi:hypothetical protein